MSFPKPRADLKPNTAEFERLPLVKPTGFREYDVATKKRKSMRSDAIRMHCAQTRHWHRE